MSEKISANIEGVIDSLNIRDFMFPLYELVVNSIQAIDEKGKEANDYIKIEIERDAGSAETLTSSVKRIKITDSGIGFTKENYESFKEAYSTKKISIGGKGVGRFAVLSVFNKVSIESTFVNNGNTYCRKFKIDRQNGTIENHTEEAVSNIAISTSIELTDINENFVEESTKYDIDRIAELLLKHCSLFYIDGNYYNIAIKEGNRVQKLDDMFSGDDFVIKSAIETIKGETFNFYAIENIKRKVNQIALCANSRTVKNKNVSTIFPLFDSPVIHKGEEKYISLYVTSTFLDRNVNHARNSFKFSTQSSADSSSMLSSDLTGISETDVERVAIRILSNMFEDDLTHFRKNQNEQIQKFYDSDEGLPYRNSKLPDEEREKLSSSPTAEEIQSVFDNYRMRHRHATRFACRKLFNRDYANTEDYRKMLKDALSSLSEDNQSNLTEYVIHRKAIIKLLDKYLCKKDNTSSHHEENVLHNLIFTMGATHQEEPYDHHNLWLIDDRLAFYKYIYSDIKFSNHEVLGEEGQSNKEPDIALYDKPSYYGDMDYSGEIRTVVLCEFKRPGRPINHFDYLKQRDDQINGVDTKKTITDYQGKIHSVNANTPIFHYFICDNNAYQSLMAPLTRAGFHVSPYETLVQIAERFRYEVMTYDRLLINAKRRNLIFFDKLGIPQ